MARFLFAYAALFIVAGLSLNRIMAGGRLQAVPVAMLTLAILCAFVLSVVATVRALRLALRRRSLPNSSDSTK